MSQPVIQADHLSYGFGSGTLHRKVLADVDLAFHAGEIVILTGPSGSGKTTLLTLIGGLRSVQGGKLEVLGEQLAGASRKSLQNLRRHIGFIFQDHNLLDALTAQQNVAMSLLLQPGMTRREALQKASHRIEEVGLADHVDKFPSELSGGQRQRVAIARAMASYPRLMLADEPTASLDKHSGREVVELMQSRAREHGLTVILVTHDNRILDVADRIVHLEDGRVVPGDEAMVADTSRMLTLLGRHNPQALDYLSNLAVALARVAFADRHITEDERQIMRRSLLEIGQLRPEEVDLAVELALTQVRYRPDTLPSLPKTHLDEARSRHLIDSLHAIAAADGHTSDEEREEIEAICQELGLI
ncbi:MAG: ATP-binding cassette domain-containing protein [Pseudomonadota bacterium]